MLAVVTPEDTGNKVDHATDLLKLKDLFGEHIILNQLFLLLLMVIVGFITE